MNRAATCRRVRAAVVALTLVTAAAACTATSGSGSTGATSGAGSLSAVTGPAGASLPESAAPLSTPAAGVTRTVTRTAAAASRSPVMGGRPSRTAVAPRTVTHTVTGRAPTANSNQALREAYNHSTAAEPEYFEADDDTLSFTSPSQNIVCTIDGAGQDIDCAIIRYDFDKPDCNLGADFVIAPNGQPQPPVCLADRVDPGAHQVLPYNYSLTSGSFACVSTTAGIACLDLDTDTGFAISRAAYARVT